MWGAYNVAWCGGVQPGVPDGGEHRMPLQYVPVCLGKSRISAVLLFLKARHIDREIGATNLAAFLSWKLGQVVCM